MKIPLSPPKFEDLLTTVTSGEDGLSKMLGLLKSATGPTPNGKYYHWDKLRHLASPEGLSSEEWWLAIKSARRVLYKPLPFLDKYGQQFVYAMPDLVIELLHQIDRDASGQLKANEPVTNPHTRDIYLVGSLIEEAITSSQLEGASTTREVAKEMLRQGRRPRNPSEQMIFNNYRAMGFIREMVSESLTPAMIFELHRILTENTLDKPSAAGHLRLPEEPIQVHDVRDGTILHVPPAASELKGRMDILCRFANQTRSNLFVHPVLKAILLHFMLSYDHPFVDGNGRAARTIFYWSMLKEGYWLIEYVPISRILRGAPSRYARSFLYTETDDADVTYFMVDQLYVITKAISDLHVYLANKTTEIQETEKLIRRSPVLQEMLNHRQINLLNHALKHPGATYRIKSHRLSHNITYQTARTDLLKLSDLDLLTKKQVGNAFVFVPAVDLHGRLQKLDAA